MVQLVSFSLPHVYFEKLILAEKAGHKITGHHIKTLRKKVFFMKQKVFLSYQTFLKLSS